MERVKSILLSMVIYLVIYLAVALLFFLQTNKGSIIGIMFIGITFAILLAIILKTFIYVKKKESHDDLPDDIENLY